MELYVDGKIDAFLGFPPEPQSRQILSNTRHRAASVDRMGVAGQRSEGENIILGDLSRPTKFFVMSPTKGRGNDRLPSVIPNRGRNDRTILFQVPPDYPIVVGAG